MNLTLHVFNICLLASFIGAAAQEKGAVQQEGKTPKTGSLVKDETVIKNFAFDRFFTQDKFGRKISLYLSKPVANQSTALPLVVCIQGSGSQSLFQEIETPDGKRIVPGGVEAVVLRAFKDKVRVLVVEKPGVKFLVQPSRPGSAEEGSEEYNREFSLDRWVEAINAATNAVLQMPNIDSKRVLAIGHSEGGQIACELAVANKRISHVAVMAGGGPVQLFDFIQMARSGDMYDPDATPEDRVAALMSDWKKVLEEPTAHNKFILGHSHLRWSSFMKSSPVTAALKTNVPIFIAQGSADTNSLPASADALYAELMARGRDVTYLRIEGADHGFMKKDDSKGEGWFSTNQKAIEWFLGK